MEFASIWVILKAESCWAAVTLYPIVEVHICSEPEPVSLSGRRAVIFGFVATLVFINMYRVAQLHLLRKLNHFICCLLDLFLFLV